MEPERWQRIQLLYHAALEREDGERTAFLDQSCAGDEDLRREVESLLAAHEDGGSFLSTPALAVEAREMAAEQTLLVAGQRLNHFQIVSLLEVGGMGEVYLARDTRLDRQVALKLLPAQFTQDAERLRRFAREAKAASALNHPNIVTIYEIGEAGDRRFIAAEFVEGLTLRQRLKAGRLEWREALEVAIQVAAALDAAHNAGIVHRDIKPENLMLRPDGLVKVLDFGLARMIEPQTPAPDGQAAVTTETGAVMGTPRYMSPEQARAQKLDGRSDLFSLGIVLYEMITGGAPFTGATTAEVFAALLEREPEPLSLRAPGTTAELQRIVRKALAKDLAERYQTAKDLRLDLQAQLARMLQPESSLPPSEAPSGGEIRPPSNSLRWRSRGAVAGGMLAVVIVAGLAWLFFHRSVARPGSSRRADMRISELLNVPHRSGTGFSDLSFSPDGKLITYSLGEGEQAHLWVRQVAGGESRQVTGDNCRDRFPIWSPDSQELAFLSDRNGASGIWTVPYLGGVPKLLKRLDGARTSLAGWSRDGRTIYLESKFNLNALDVNSGQISPITHFDPQHSSARSFRVSPDDRQVAYSDLVGGRYCILTVPVQGGEPREVTQGVGGDDRSPAWFPDRSGIAYCSKRDGIYQLHLLWLDGRDPVQITFGSEDFENVTVSPDGVKIIAVSSRANANLFACDLRTGRETRQTSEFSVELSPDVSADGRALAFQATKSVLRSDDSIFVQSRLTPSQPARLASSGFDPKWSPVQDRLAFLRPSNQGTELWLVSASGGDEQRLATGVLFGGMTLVPFNRLDTNYNWSPDGTKISYFSNKSGQYNLWVVAVDGSGDAKISNNTNPKQRITSPFWSPRGDRIAYVSEFGEKRSIVVTGRGESTSAYEDDKPLRLVGWAASGEDVIVASMEGKGSPDVPRDLSLLGVTADGKKLRVIAHASAAYLHNIKLSRDGRSIAFVSRQADTNEVEVVSTSGGPVRRITSNNDPAVYFSGLTWSPDGKTLFYSKQTNWTLVSVIENF